MKIHASPPDEMDPTTEPVDNSPSRHPWRARGANPFNYAIFESVATRRAVRLPPLATARRPDLCQVKREPASREPETVSAESPRD
jgi:hypothetical protein